MSGVAKGLGLVPKMPALTPQSGAARMPTINPTEEVQKARKRASEKASTGREGTRLSDAGTQSYSGGLLGE